MSRVYVHIMQSSVVQYFPGIALVYAYKIKKKTTAVSEMEDFVESHLLQAACLSY